MRRRIHEVASWAFVLCVAAGAVAAMWYWPAEPESATSPEHPDCPFCVASKHADHAERIRVYDAELEARKRAAARDQPRASDDRP